MSWQNDFPLQPQSFGLSFDTAQQHEDWEDWLRWDPAAESTSPDDGTLPSGSSKNDSPIQGTLLENESDLFAKVHDTLAPPLILGDDALDFRDPTVVNNDSFMFGGLNQQTTSFDFRPLLSVAEPTPGVSKLDTDISSWPRTFNSSLQDINLAALSAKNYNILPPSAGTASSTAPSLHYSPGSTPHVRTSISSNSPPPPKKRGGRKRKASIVEAELREQQEREANGESQDGDEPPNKKSHNVIEKRYRNNLSDKIAELKDAVPSLRAMGRTNRGDESEDLEGLTPAHKLNKATVMGKATEYIRHLEKRNKTMADEMEALQARLADVEAAIGRSRERQASISHSPPDGTVRPRNTSAASQSGAQSFLNARQEPNRFHQQVIPQQYTQQQHQPNYARPPGPPVDAQNQPQYVNGRGGGGLMSKVMLGTMAGIMVMEGFTEQEPTDEKAPLSSIPMSLWKRSSDSTSIPISGTWTRQATLPLAKTLLVIGALLYLLIPLISFSPRRKQKSRSSAVRLPPAPSLASPIEVRRKAWLTAIQSVWVPKHFLLEVVAVTLKIVGLSLRQLVGSEAYSSITGANKDDETARVKAWDIAIDAQLAGGDQEVGYYRLLLTLMESGTLPDSPTRLMQKAVHFRVFFWEVANAGYGNMSGFKRFTERVGNYYWESARRLQKDLVQAEAQNQSSQAIEDDVDLLPDHLAGLVELECGDVLSDEMIQRAWNLAWNKPSAYRTVRNEARDAVVEDHAVRSPLDAVAAWYANTLVDDTLAEALGEHVSTIDTEYHTTLAISIAPPGSSTLARSLAAKAVLSNSNRSTNIATALQALPATAISNSEMNVVSHIPAAPEVRVALTLAKLLALSSPTALQLGLERVFGTVAALHLPPESFTLLTAVAVLRLLKTLSTQRGLPIDTKHGLEDFAANLRVWVGVISGADSTIGKAECAHVVDTCLSVAKKVGGWEQRDSAYASLENSPTRETVVLSQ